MALTIDTTKKALFYGDKSKRLSTTFIVVHSTASDSAVSTLSWFQNPANPAKSSSHYLVGKDGHIWQLVDDECLSWHAGKSQWTYNGKKYTDLNRHSIGVEVVCAELSAYTPEQIAALKGLTEYLAAKHFVTISNILTHYEIAPKRKRDPYPANIDFNQFRNTLTVNSMTDRELNIPVTHKLAEWEQDIYSFVKSKETSVEPILHDTDAFVKDPTPYKILSLFVSLNPKLKEEYVKFLQSKHAL